MTTLMTAAVLIKMVLLSKRMKVQVDLSLREKKPDGVIFFPDCPKRLRKQYTLQPSS